MTFDPTQFIDQTIEGQNDTKIIPVPINDEGYIAVIDKIMPRTWQSNDGTQSGITLDVFWRIDDANLAEELGREKIIVKQGIMLDVTETGGLDMGKGKNITLGRLREALNLNQPGKAFSFNQLPGQVGRISIKHRVVGEDIFAEVKAVTAV